MTTQLDAFLAAARNLRAKYDDSVTNYDVICRVQATLSTLSADQLSHLLCVQAPPTCQCVLKKCPSDLIFRIFLTTFGAQKFWLDLLVCAIGARILLQTRLQCGALPGRFGPRSHSSLCRYFHVHHSLYRCAPKIMHAYKHASRANPLQDPSFLCLDTLRFSIHVM